MFLWELNNTIFLQYLHVTNCSAIKKHHLVWTVSVWKALWFQLCSQDSREQDVFSQFSSLLRRDGEAVFSFHTLGWCFGFRGLSAVGPGFPRALQGQGLLLVHHNVIHSLVGHAAARPAALLLKQRKKPESATLKAEFWSKTWSQSADSYALHIFLKLQKIIVMISMYQFYFSLNHIPFSLKFKMEEVNNKRNSN